MHKTIESQMALLTLFLFTELPQIEFTLVYKSFIIVSQKCHIAVKLRPLNKHVIVIVS